MKLLTLFWGIIFAVFCLAGVAFAQVAGEPTTLPDAVQMIPTILAMFKAGKSLAASAGAIIVILYFVRIYVLPKANLSAKVLPLVSAILGLIGGPLVAAYMGADAKEAMLAALSGPMASTLWSALFKYILPEVKA